MRDTIKFAVVVGVLVAVAVGSAGAGYTFGFVHGYNDCWERINVQSIEAQERRANPDHPGGQ